MIENPIADLISKDLRRWFKEKWVDVSRKDKDGKHPPCGRSDAKTSSKGYPKCRPSKKVSEKTPKTTKNMSAKEKKAATRRKRSKPQGVGGKPTMVKSVFDKAWNVMKEKAHESATGIHAMEAGYDDYDDGVPFSEGVKAWSHNADLLLAYKKGYENAMKYAVEIGNQLYGDEKLR